MSQRFFAPSASLLNFLRCQTDGFAPCCQKSFRSAAKACSKSKPLATPSDLYRRSREPIISTSHPRRSDPRSIQVLCQQHATFATSSRTSFLGLWGKQSDVSPRAGDRRTGNGLNELPPLPKLLEESGAMGMMGLGRTTRPTHEMKLRCTELNQNGDVTLTNGEFKKTELIAKYGLLPRDLRKIDSSLLPHILVRESAILLNLLHLRVLIKHDRVLVLDAYGTTDSYNQSVFMYDLEGRLRQKEAPANGTLGYEFRALEAVLISVTNALESEFDGVSEPVIRVLQQLEDDIDRDKLRYLLVYAKKLGTFEQKARLVRDSLTELLEADDDLSAMYLSEKAASRARSDDDHAEVELLLESYHRVADEIVQAAENLVSNIRNTEEIVKAILDANRNSLMLLDLKFSIFTLGLTAGTFVAALYGMNLKNFIEESDLGFGAVSAWCSIFAAVVCVGSLKSLRKIQRVSMWGEHGAKRRPAPRLPGLGLGSAGHGGGSAASAAEIAAPGGAAIGKTGAAGVASRAQLRRERELANKRKVLARGETI